MDTPNYTHHIFHLFIRFFKKAKRKFYRADFPLARIGGHVENHPIFPERVNFEIARVLNQNKLEARVWERGAGETLSCGSGASAIAVIAKLKGYTDNEVDIILPGGNLSLNWDGVGEVYLSGPVEEVFTGEWL